MPDDRVRRQALTGPRHRRLSLVPALVFAVLLVLSGCVAQAGAQSPSGPDAPATSTSGARPTGTAEEGGSAGWTVFLAGAEQWQVKFSLMQIGSPWAQGTPLVSHLAPGADPRCTRASCR